MSAPGISAVVLAGTHRWSGSIFERLAPRPLVPVALAPLITYPLRWLAAAGVPRATVCANGTTRDIEAALGDGRGLGMQLSYYKDSTPRGAAGCARDAGLEMGSDTLVVVDGTAIPTVDLARLLEAHLASGAAMTAVVHREEGAPPTPGGVYVVERRALGQVPENGFQDIKENLIPRLHRAGARVVAHESGAGCPHVFNAQTYLAVSQWMLQRLAAEEESGRGPLVDPTASVEPGVRFVGPVQVGPGAYIAAGATVVGPSTIGPDSAVGGNALVARSVLWSRCVVGEGAVVHGCVAGNDADIPPAARLFNAVHAASPLQARGAATAHPAPSIPATARIG
jgi:NDP-sugar pyrophosphorylase family protein